ncbi:MAG: hypothetical protein JKY20_11130 [Alphaproteobacteria bacterium]|nr:hypothetical protein [Alphaproteobacteria bacterium]
MSDAESIQEPIHVVLVPGADALVFNEDIAAAQQRGAQVWPVIYGPPTGHPIDDCEAYYQSVSQRITVIVDEIRASSPAPLIFAFGRNLGGSILAYHAAQKNDFRALVMIGVIPELTTFRRHGAHQSATTFRQRLAESGELARIEDLEHLDMTTSLKSYPADQCLIQVGERDDYMDERAFDAFRALEARFPTEWLDDVHAMVEPDTLARRWTFIEALVN